VVKFIFMTLLASPHLALGFGVFLALAETCRRWGNWPFLPFLLDDWIAGMLLVYGGVRAGRDWASGRPFQVAGWGFASGMLYMSFFGHLEHRADPQEAGWVPHGVLLGIVGFLFALAVAGLASTLSVKGREAAARLGGQP
jgi:hypothetical protein